MKQLLLIGDSIRMGYCETVKTLLAEEYEVIFPKENCRMSQNILTSLGSWVSLCRREDVAVVQFNCGHWDAARFGGDSEPLTSLSEYEKNLRAIVRRLRGYFPAAKLVFATTTPMNPAHPETINARTTDEIRAYNAVAETVMREMDVVVNDLFAATTEWGGEAYADYCHFTPEAFARLGGIAAAYLRAM